MLETTAALVAPPKGSLPVGQLMRAAPLLPPCRGWEEGVPQPCCLRGLSLSHPLQKEAVGLGRCG